MTSETLSASLAFTLFKRIADLKEEKSKLQDKVDSQCELIRHLQNELSQESMENKQLEDIVQESLGMIGYFKQENQELQANCLILRQENRDLQTNLSDCQRQNQKLQSEFCQSTEVIQSLTETNKELQDISHYLENVEDLKKVSRNLNVTVEENLAKITKQESRNKTKEIIFRREITGLNDKFQTVGHCQPFDQVKKIVQTRDEFKQKFDAKSVEVRQKESELADVRIKFNTAQKKVRIMSGLSIKTCEKIKKI